MSSRKESSQQMMKRYIQQDSSDDESTSDDFSIAINYTQSTQPRNNIMPFRFYDPTSMPYQSLFTSLIYRHRHHHHHHCNHTSLLHLHHVSFGISTQQQHRNQIEVRKKVQVVQQRQGAG